jgi:gas vesicle protein GvpG
MGLFTFPFKLPLRPVQGVIRLGELLEDEAERELHDPARIRRVLEEAQRQYEAGEISAEEFSQVQDEVASTMVGEAPPPSASGAVEDRS